MSYTCICMYVHRREKYDCDTIMDVISSIYAVTMITYSLP